jgi:flagellar transcriptional activator FlhC
VTRPKSVLAESKDIRRAVELIELGARLQVLESETRLSRERLLRLYKEVQGKSPPKGMLPFSTDWFMTWQPNVHSSLFMGIYRYLDKSAALEQVDLVIKAFRLYLEQVRAQGMPQVLSVTRAWRLVKFFDAGMLTTAPCTRCGGHFVVHAQELVKDYVCGLCEMPSRAGKTRAPQSAQARAA